MAKRYFAGYMDAKILAGHSTEKAFYVGYDKGYMGRGHEGYVWIPKSICKFEDVNECGWIKFYIPQWFLTKNRLDYHRMTVDINWCGNGEAFIVDM